MRPTLFVSDLHLDASRPEMTTAFERLLSGPTREAEALWILGDLFEYWAGDDDFSDPLNARIAAAVSAATALGAKIRLMRGNRDFLMGELFAILTGVELVTDPAVVSLAGERTVLSHGDALCTDDVEYQKFRGEVRDPKWARRFLATPVAERRARIQEMRRRSEAEKRIKPAAIMDVNPQAVTDLFRSSRASRMIHGHTHRPGHHRHEVDGRTCERWVLADWYTGASALACDAGGIRTLQLS